MRTNQITGSNSDWLESHGPHNPIVITSRIRFARNLKGRSFPGWARKPERLAILSDVLPKIAALPAMADCVLSDSLADLTALDKQVLVERHLISREHAARSVGSAVAINQGQSLSIMVNEEDHLRMQSIYSGLQIQNAFTQLDEIDSQLEDNLDFAFHSQFGYLTACPTNLGTGMRASVMVHLPALVLGDQINRVIQAVNKIGLAVRGLYGEGTEALGNLFQVSNQTTMGESEAAIIGRLVKVIHTIIGHEQNARRSLVERRPGMVMDQIGRAYGILNHAHSMSSKETLNLLSLLRLGVDLGVFPELVRLPVDELFMETQPAHLQKNSRKKLAAEQRDSLRAEIIREKLKLFPEPDILQLQNGNGAAESSSPPTTDDE